MINFKVILNVLGILLLALSALMLFPLIADLIKNNNGEYVASGVYLLAITNNSGKNTFSKVTVNHRT